MRKVGSNLSGTLSECGPHASHPAKGGCLYMSTGSPPSWTRRSASSRSAVNSFRTRPTNTSRIIQIQNIGNINFDAISSKLRERLKVRRKRLPAEPRLLTITSYSTGYSAREESNDAKNCYFARQVEHLGGSLFGNGAHERI